MFTVGSANFLPASSVTLRRSRRVSALPRAHCFRVELLSLSHSFAQLLYLAEQLGCGAARRFELLDVSFQIVTESLKIFLDVLQFGVESSHRRFRPLETQEAKRLPQRGVRAIFADAFGTVIASAVSMEPVIFC